MERKQIHEFGMVQTLIMFESDSNHTAAKFVLDGTISDRGVLAPMYSKLNDPLMKELKEKYGYVVFTLFHFLFPRTLPGFCHKGRPLTEI